MRRAGQRRGGRRYGRGRRRSISWVTAPATRTPVAATVAAVRTTLVTASPDGCGAGSAGWRRVGRAPPDEAFRAPVAPR